MHEMSTGATCCLVCEDFRQELNGRATIVGFSGALPHQGLKLKSLALPVPPLVFLFLIEPGLHFEQLYLEMQNPNGSLLFQTARQPVPARSLNAGLQLPFRLNNFKPVEFGTHHLRLLSEKALICDYGLPVVPILPPVPPPAFGLLN